jgi:hypothetical protein
MLYLFAIQLILFCILIANVAKLLITLIIKN